MTAASQRVPIPGEILTPTQPKVLIAKTMRVLLVEQGERDRVVLIAVEPITSRGRKYFQGPITLRLSDVEKDLALKRCRIVEGGVAPVQTRLQVMKSLIESTAGLGRKNQEPAKSASSAGP